MVCLYSIAQSIVVRTSLLFDAFTKEKTCDIHTSPSKKNCKVLLQDIITRHCGAIELPEVSMRGMLWE
eukprot:4688890-Amphidinium_carterae.2